MIRALTYRQAVVADAHALAVFGAECFADTFAHLYSSDDLNDYLATAYAPSQHLAWLEDGAQYFCVAEDEGGIAGYVKCGPCKLPVDTLEMKAFELCRLYVHRRAQSRGIGSHLVAHCLELARIRGYQAVFLGVWENNFGAQALYKRFGFVEVGEYAYPVGGHLDRELIFRLIL